MKIAIFTNKENEDPLWPIWTEYYRKHIDEIFTVGLVNTVAARRSTAFVKEANVKQKELLADFDVVVYADIDEFLIPDPEKYDGLRDYIEQHWDKLPRATGYQLIHNGEDEIDLTRPLLSQRSWWAHDELYSKRLIIHKPIGWAPGFHSLAGQKAPPEDPDLILLHVLYMDDKLALQRQRVTYPLRSITQVREKIKMFELSAVPERLKIV